MIEETKAWVKKAKSDLNSAKILKDLKEFDTSCYHSQQAAEKYLKAVLCEHNLDIPKTHDLPKLASMVSAVLVIPEDILDEFSDISRYSALTRYPGYDANFDDAETAFLSSVKVESFVLSALTKFTKIKLKNPIQSLFDMASEAAKNDE